MPGVETRLPLLFSEGVGPGRIDLPTFAALSATNAAKLYGLYPRKGTIAVGSDADLALWNPEREAVITNALLHHHCDYTPYEGMTVRELARGRPLPRRGGRRGGQAPGPARAGPVPALRPDGAPLVQRV